MMRTRPGVIVPAAVVSLFEARGAFLGTVLCFLCPVGGLLRAILSFLLGVGIRFRRAGCGE